MDQYSHPVFLEHQAGVERELSALFPVDGDLDPYRLDWAETRGRTWPVEFTNRYCATLRGDLFAPPDGFVDPVTGQNSPGPYPLVVVVGALGTPHQSYQWLAQGLAESGYVALTFDPQGQWSSDVQPGTSDADGDDCDPEVDYCDPDGEWRRPQEGGLRQHGPCAGVLPETSVDQWLTVAYEAATGDLDDYAIHQLYLLVGANWVFGTIDAVDWLLDDDPTGSTGDWRSLIDSARIGAVGHSAGGFGAMVAANVDERIDAAVTVDAYGLLPEADRVWEQGSEPELSAESDLAEAIRNVTDSNEPIAEATVPPSVPTLQVAAEQAEYEHPREVPPADDRAPSRNAQRFRTSGVDTMAVYVRGASHHDFTYGVYDRMQSRYAERIGFHYTLGWLDRYVKRRHHAVQEDALRRLTLRTFDDSADRSAIGLGRWDPVAQRNMPYLLNGRRVTDHLSHHFRSFAAFDGFTCDDLRMGCT